MAREGGRGCGGLQHVENNVSLQNFSGRSSVHKKWSKKQEETCSGDRGRRTGTDGDGRGPSHVGTGTQWGAWALTHTAQNHLEALFSIGLNCRGASEEIVKGKYLEPSSMSKPPSRTSHVSIIKIFEKKELPDDDGFFLVKVKEVVLRAGDECGQV